MSLREAASKSGLSHAYIRDLEIGVNRKTKAPINPSPETLKSLSEAYNYPYEELMERAGHITKVQLLETAFSQGLFKFEYPDGLEKNVELKGVIEEIKLLETDNDFFSSLPEEKKQAIANFFFNNFTFDYELVDSLKTIRMDTQRQKAAASIYKKLPDLSDERVKDLMKYADYLSKLED